MTAAAGQAIAQPDLRTEIELAIGDEGLVGVVWTTVTPEEVATGAVGVADVEQGAVLSPDSKVQTGSIAKTFVAAGILRLVTEGRLELDSPVATLLPGVALENPWASSNPVLVRHLLDHTAGLDDARLWQIFSLNAEPDTTLSASLPPDGLQIRSRPGSRLSYSNLGYTLLGMVIEHITGERYEQYLDTHLLRPLGMHDSTFQFVSQEGPHADTRLAMGHFENAVNQAAVPLYLRPAGQFTTTAPDMGRFLLFLMSDGEIDGEVFIAPHLLEAMGSPTTTEAAFAGLLDAGYGLGLNSRDRHGVLGNCHTGTTVGFRSNFCLFRQENKAFFVAMNADVEEADYARFDALLIQQLGVASAVPARIQPPPDRIGNWQGIYVLAPNRTESFAYLDLVLNFASVTWDGRQLHLRSLQGPAASLVPAGGLLFRAEGRISASHALLVSEESRQVISDGFRSYEKASLWRMVLLWTSLAAGLAGLLYVILVGGVRILRRRLHHSEPLFMPLLASTALFIPIPFFFSQSFLQIGDLTLASGLLAMVTGLLPVAMLYGLWRSRRGSISGRRATLDQLAMIGVLQWSIVLAVWGLMPLRLWV